MKKGDYQSQRKAKAYESGRFSGNLTFVATDEAKIIESWLRRVKSGGIYLDLGSGTGRIVRSIVKSKPKKVYALDTSNAMLQELKSVFPKEVKRKKIKLVISSANKVPLKNKSIDVVTAFHLFKHLNNIETAISEASRVLTKKGYLIFDVLNSRSAVSLNLGDCYAYSENSVSAILKRNNFKIVKIVYLHSLGETIYKFLGFPLAKSFSKIDRDISKLKLGTKIVFLAEKI